jgi:hypothetical protein
MKTLKNMNRVCSSREENKKPLTNSGLGYAGGRLNGKARTAATGDGCVAVFDDELHPRQAFLAVDPGTGQILSAHGVNRQVYAILDFKLLPP